MSFCHLHNHTHYSMLDGAQHIPTMVARAKELGMPGIGVTEHGNLHSAIQVYKECRKQGIVPVLGYEAYLVTDCRYTDRQRCELYHLTILAKNREGWNNLRRLSTIASTAGFYYKPRLDKDLLAQHRHGLIILSGCLASEVSRSALQGKIDRDLFGWYERMFGDDFYLELMRNGSQVQEQAYDQLVYTSHALGIQPVASSDCHYTEPTDWDLQDTMVCINIGQPRSSPVEVPRMQERVYYLRSPEEMRSMFPAEACDNTLRILDKIDLEIETGVRHFPVSGLPEPKETLRRMVNKGILERLGGCTIDQFHRLDRELKVIHDLGFDEYFLIVADICRFARENGIFYSARGSGVGSLVSYSLYISHVNPLDHGLLFERFLDPSRKEAPDIDLDFDKDRRAEVLEYVRSKYGEDHVAQIGTFGTLGAKSAIRDVAKAMATSVGDLAEHISDLPGTTLEDAEHTAAVQNMLKDSRIAAVWSMAKRIEGMARSFGTHAAGVVISDLPLVDYVPLMLSKEDGIVTQWDMNDCEAVGLMKMDFLGLRNLTIVQNCIDMIQDATGKRIDLHKIPMGDIEVYRMLSKGGTKGVFQLESSGMTGLVEKLVPTEIEHICACIALYRPGPLDCGMVDTYVERRKGAAEWSYPHTSMAEILDVTYGVMVYQEQVMLVLHRVGNISLSESYSCIKAIGKKIKAKVDYYKPMFVQGCAENGVDGEALWSQIATFARYGFNKSHSMAYAYLAYQTAWLKYHFPRFYMAAVLNTDIDQRSFNKRDDLLIHLDDAQANGITVLPPHLNHSRAAFSVWAGELVWGLAALKGVSWSAAREIEGNAPYRDLFDLCKRCPGVPRQALVNLIRSGALDICGLSHFETRAIQEANVDRAIKVARGQYKQLDKYDGVYEDAEPLPRGVTLAREREIAGCYLSGHPLDENATLRLLGGPRWLPGDTPCAYAGLINSVEVRHTKGKREFVTFWVDGVNGSVECIAWDPKVIHGKVDHMVAVLGRVNRRGSSSTLSVTKVVSIDDFIAGLRTALQIRVMDLNSVDKVYAIAKSNPGPIDLIVECNGIKFGRQGAIALTRDAVSQLAHVGVLSLAQDYKLTPIKLEPLHP